MKTWYDKEEDILNIQMKDDRYWKSVELENGVVFDIGRDGAILSIEILKASRVFSKDLRKVIDAAEKK